MTAAAALGLIFVALEKQGCEPELTADGRGIVATCPNCNEERGLFVYLGKPQSGAQ